MPTISHSSLHHANLTAADAVWIATALLHRDAPSKAGFTVRDIEEKVAKEHLFSKNPKTIYQHAQSHAVANLPLHLNSDGLRLLYAVGTLRRLYTPGDDFAPARHKGREMTYERLPARYQDLWDWYSQWSKTVHRRLKAHPEDPLLALVGSGRKIWADEHADEYVRRLREDWQ